MTKKQPQEDVSAITVGTVDERHVDNSRLPTTTKGTELLEDLNGFFTRRKHGRIGLYLPLVRVQSAD